MHRFAVLVPGPVTPASLRDFAFETDTNAALVPDADPDQGLRRVHMRRHAEWARFCAKKMEAEAVETALHYGPFSTVIFRPGMKVRIKAGARRRSMNPRVPSEGELVKRPFNVTVHAAYAGFCDPFDPPSFRQPTVQWVGASGYFFWVNPEDAEMVGAPAQH